MYNEGLNNPSQGFKGGGHDGLLNGMRSSGELNKKNKAGTQPSCPNDTAQRQDLTTDT